jgi:hypothetical protein
VGVLTRDDMQRVIADGGSVLHGRTVISRIDDLPSETDLARDDPAQLEHVRAALEAQRAALDAQLAHLDRQRGDVPRATALPEGSPPAPPPEPEPDPTFEPEDPPTEPEEPQGKSGKRR